MEIKEILSWRWFKWCLPWVFVLVIVIPTFWVQINGPKDYYPYYAWEMFSYPSPTETFYRMEVQSYNGKILASSESLFQLRHFYLRDKSVASFFKIQNMVKSIVNNSSDDVGVRKVYQQIRAILKENFMSLKINVYEIKFKKTEYAKNKKILDKKFLFDIDI